MEEENKGLIFNIGTLSNENSYLFEKYKDIKYNEDQCDIKIKKME
jgi:hypothetical protein